MVYPSELKNWIWAQAKALAIRLSKPAQYDNIGLVSKDQIPRLCLSPNLTLQLTWVYIIPFILSYNISLHALNDDEEALYIRRLVSLKEKNEAALFHQYAEAFLQNHPDGPYTPYVILMLAEAAIESKDDTKALSLLNQLKNSPLQEKASMHQLMIWRHHGQWSEIHQAFESRNSVSSDETKHALYLAQGEAIWSELAEGIGDKKAAIAFYIDFARQVNKVEAEGYLLLAFELEENKENKLKILTKSSRLNGPRQFEINILLAVLCDQLERTLEGYQFLSNYVQHHLYSSELKNWNLGIDLLEKKEAFAEKALLTLTRLAFKLGDVAKAQQWADLYLTNHPNAQEANAIILLLAKIDLDHQRFTKVVEKTFIVSRNATPEQQEYAVYLKQEALQGLKEIWWPLRAHLTQEILTEKEQDSETKKEGVKLHLARARYEKEQNEAIQDLKQIAKCQIFSHEPNHLEAAIDLFLFEKKEPLSAYKELLNMKEHFLQEEDIPSKEYHEQRRSTPENEHLFQSYLLLIDGYLALTESQIALEYGLRAEQIRKEKMAKKIFNTLLMQKEGGSQYILDHARQGLVD